MIMPYSVVFVPLAAKQCSKIKDKKLKDRISSALEYLAYEPFSGKPLQAELKGCYSFRVGDYRIVYTFSKEKIMSVLRIDHRREVYR